MPSLSVHTFMWVCLFTYVCASSYLYMGVSICICVCICACISRHQSLGDKHNLWIRTHTHTHTHIFIYIHPFSFCPYLYVSVSICPCMCISLHVCVYLHMCVLYNSVSICICVHILRHTPLRGKQITNVKWFDTKWCADTLSPLVSRYRWRSRVYDMVYAACATWLIDLRHDSLQCMTWCMPLHIWHGVSCMSDMVYPMV